MTKILFTNKKYKYLLILGICILIVINVLLIFKENNLAYFNIAFQILLLILILLQSKISKSIIDVYMILYGIMMSFNLIISLIPLILDTIKSPDNINSTIFFDVFVFAIGLILAVLLYKINEKHISLSEKTSSNKR